MQLHLRVALNNFPDQAIAQFENLFNLFLFILPVFEQTLKPILIRNEEEYLDQNLHDE